MLTQLIKKNRSYRRYHRAKIDRSLLKKLVNLARLSASSRNLQPLRYYLSWDKQTNARIFSCLGWAMNLKNWPGPQAEQTPSAYIIINYDQEIAHPLGANVNFDIGIAAQSILLGAVEQGLVGCMLASINKPKLAKLLKIPSTYEIGLVVALGKPGEKVVLENIKASQSTKYYRDKNDHHHVPKIRLQDLIINPKKHGKN
ncbi:MAG: nitroreductase [Candidatus Moranbacteria bacterium]|nr:nitroreductase [Candidatus Moranbacteria bacterium]